MFPLSRYAEDATHLQLEAFELRYGSAFLLFEGDPEHLRPTSILDETMTPDLPYIKKGKGIAQRPWDNLFVLPVLHSGRSAFTNFVSVGRTQSNDIVINDESVSKLHAFFKRDKQGQHLLGESGSRNGTFVERKRLKKVDGPVPLSSGQPVRFGNIDLMFLDAPAFVELVQRTQR